MKRLVYQDGIMRMGMYLITNVMCFYDFQISNGFVTTTNAKYEKNIYIMIISSITKSVRLVEIEEFNHTN